MNEQHTLARPASFEGTGLHTGRPARATVSPAPPGHGLRFRLDGGRVELPALVEHVVDTSRATVLGAEGATVSTVEHLLSALAGLGVDNALIAVEGPEIPIMDGSALAFVEGLDAAGVVAQAGSPRRVLEPRAFAVEEGGMRVAVEPAPRATFAMEVDFRAPIGAQAIRFDPAGDAYRESIAPARTFGYLDEVEALRARGLALGGTLENAVVFGPEGPLAPLRFADEPVRHKTLDLIGDLVLAGAPLRASVSARRSGHALHAAASRRLREQVLAAR